MRNKEISSNPLSVAPGSLHGGTIGYVQWWSEARHGRDWCCRSRVSVEMNGQVSTEFTLMLVLLGLVLWVPWIGERSLAEHLLTALINRVLVFGSWMAHS